MGFKYGNSYNDADNQVFVNLARNPMPWHSAGVSIPQAISQGWGFDGPVPRESLETMFGEAPIKCAIYDEMGIQIPDAYVVRAKDGRLVNRNIVSENYVAHDPATWAAMTLDVIAQADCDIETAGKLGNGALYFFSSLPNDDKFFEVQGLKASSFLNFSTSFDGTQASNLSVSTVLQVCENTVAMSNRSRRIVSVKHCAGSTDRFDVDQVREALGIARLRSEAEMNALAEMGSTLITPHQWDVIVRALIPIKDDATPKGITQGENKRTELRSIYTDDKRVQIFPVMSVARAFQAWNTYTHHGSTMRGNDMPMIQNIVRGQKGVHSMNDGKFFEVVKSLEIALPELAMA